jgi:N-methylhydantoinase B
LSKDQAVAISEGDIVHVGTPGGGGYGDPLARAPDLVARDVARGYYTVEQAADIFGVVIADTAAEMAQTAKLRAGRQNQAAE